MSINRIIISVTLSLLFICALPMVYTPCHVTYASEAGEKQEPALKNKVDTTNLSGVDLLIANLYNNDRVMYAVVVTLVMAALGTTLAFLTDLVLKMLGVEVTRISHRE